MHVLPRLVQGQRKAWDIDAVRVVEAQLAGFDRHGSTTGMATGIVALRVTDAGTLRVKQRRYHEHGPTPPLTLHLGSSRVRMVPRPSNDARLPSDGNRSIASLQHRDRIFVPFVQCHERWSDRDGCNRLHSKNQGFY